MNSPVLGSTSSNVSKKGSNCRCAGRPMIQKRLLSGNPAEAKIKRFTGVAAVEANASTRSTSKKGTYMDNMDSTNVERLIRHLSRFRLIPVRKWPQLRNSPPFPLPQKRLSEEPFAANICVQSVNTVSASHLLCHVPPTQTITSEPYPTPNAWRVNARRARRRCTRIGNFVLPGDPVRVYRSSHSAAARLP